MSLTGIIGAMDLEMKALIDLLEKEECRTISNVTFYKGKIFEHDAVLAVCGVGKCFSALCAQTMILEYHPDCIINIGVAGGIVDGLSVGDIVVANDVVQYDMDTSAVGDPVGLISGINIVKIPCSPKLTEGLFEAAKTLQIPVVRGTVASGDTFVASREKKEKIAETFDAVACEMEGGGIAQACYVNNVECAILRSISDGIDGGGGDYEAFKHAAAKNSTAVLSAFFRGCEG